MSEAEPFKKGSRPLGSTPWPAHLVGGLDLRFVNTPSGQPVYEHRYLADGSLQITITIPPGKQKAHEPEQVTLEANPATQFIESVQGALNSGRVAIYQGDHDDRLCNWIGFVDREDPEWTYLNPDAVLNAINDYWVGEPVSSRQKLLFLLSKSGIILPEKTRRMRLHTGERRTMWAIPTRYFEEDATNRKATTIS